MKHRLRQLVVGASVSAIIATGLTVSPAGAHITRVGHLWRDHIKPKLAVVGTINNTSNPVDWTQLKNVPSGLADGVDDVGGGGGGGGDITSVTAGSGLTGGGTSGDVTLSLDASALNAAKSSGFSGYKDAAGTTNATARAIGSLSLPAGNYLIFGKITAMSSGTLADVDCVLSAGGDSDRSAATVDATIAFSTMSFNVAHTFGGAGNAVMTCRTTGPGGTVNLRDLKISAIRFPDAVSNVALP